MSTEVVATLGSLVAADVRSADRDTVARMVGAMGEVRSWLDAFEVRCARRTRELAATGASAGPESALVGSRRSGREAAAAAEREVVCSAMGAVEDALAHGSISAGHVDAIARATKGLDDDTRCALHGLEDELVAAAETDRVETFERRVRDQVKLLQAQRSTSDADELDRQRAQSTIKRWTDKTTGMRHTHLSLDPLRDHSLWAAINRAVTRARQDDRNANKPWMQLQIDALVDAVRADRAGAGKGDDATGRPPDPAHRLPEATVLIDLGTLLHELHARSICELDDGTPLSVSTMRRLLCDCEALPAVLSGCGVTLDVGRSERTVTRNQRRALRAMHRNCAHPDCTVGFADCRIHHVRWWWRDTGPTDLDNLLPLCERHHHLVHEGGWDLTMTPDRIATWKRPDGSVAHEGSCIDRAPDGVARPRPPDRSATAVDGPDP